MPRCVVPPMAIQISCKVGGGVHVHERGQREGPVRTRQSTDINITHVETRHPYIRLFTRTQMEIQLST